MNNNDYPSGSDTKEAPWNQGDKSSMKFHVVVTEMLEKKDTLGSKDYIVLNDDPDNFSIDVTNIDFVCEWEKQQYDILGLLKELERLARKELEQTPQENIGKIMHFNKIIESCQGWEKVELNVEQY